MTADISFETGAGAAVIKFSTYADATPYKASISGSVPCVSGGGIAVFYSNAISPTIDLASIARATVTYTNLAGTFVLHPGAPIVESAMISESTPGTGFWRVSGTVRATQSVTSVMMAVFPRMATGLLTGELDAVQSTLTAGTTWSYQTTAYEGARFATFLQFLSFSEGLSAFALEDSEDAGSSAESAALAALTAERAERAERLERALR